ncbi:hypothetical protein NL676_008618 [Syzygium grande]|nr:hypothetical protein NL676_008618 [Syzygium grande]
MAGQRGRRRGMARSQRRAAPTTAHYWHGRHRRATAARENRKKSSRVREDKERGGRACSGLERAADGQRQARAGDGRRRGAQGGKEGGRTVVPGEKGR